MTIRKINKRISRNLREVIRQKLSWAEASDAVYNLAGLAELGLKLYIRDMVK